MRQAFTLVELLIVVAIIGILYSVTLYLLRPEVLKARAHDAVRLADLAKLQAAIEGYIADNGVPPGSSGILRQSNIAAAPPANPSQASAAGWMGVDLTSRLDRLPLDPLNTNGYIYRYERVGQNYELDAQLEYYTDLMKNDGGNSDGRLEKGTDLTILGD